MIRLAGSVYRLVRAALGYGHAVAREYVDMNKAHADVRSEMEQALQEWDADWHKGRR